MILADGLAFVLERWLRSGDVTLASNGRPVWLIPLQGGGAIDGDRLEPGGVWLVDAGAFLRLDPGTELLVAYAGTGVIDRLLGSCV